MQKRIGISVGDPAGIGPELALRVASDWPKTEAALLIVADDALLRRVANEVHLPCPPTIDRHRINELTNGVAVLNIAAESMATINPGTWSAATGRASYQWVCAAVELAIAGDLHGIVTGPIQKEAWHAAGIEYPGHTELLAAMTETSDYRMMLTSPEISCVLATIHIPLADVADQLTSDDVYSSIRLGSEALSRRHRRPARVTVCGLNPHAGENGLFSHGEEQRIIAPAIARAMVAGIQVTGPVSPDTAFTPAKRNQTDVYVCMYHDQGLIPLKAISFDDAVNVTLGLPIVRTSVDHGTAMDIAWRGVASDKSLRAAIQLAIDLS